VFFVRRFNGKQVFYSARIIDIDIIGFDESDCLDDLKSHPLLSERRVCLVLPLQEIAPIGCIQKKTFQWRSC
jgi:7,8-dihydro-6-hydroxymethylpterin-pyrophosphokinase